MDLIDNEPRMIEILDVNATNLVTMERMLVNHLISSQEAIIKEGEEVRALTEDTKLDYCC